MSGSGRTGNNHGQGILTLPDGRQRSGVFADGTLVREIPATPSALTDNHKAPVTRRAQRVVAPAPNAGTILPPAARAPGEYPEASTGLLTEADLRHRTATELRMMVNEIYARHSHIFKSAGLQEHFRRQSWYAAKQQVDWSMLTSIEQTNIKAIRKYQAEHR
jgi:hypothetical protein